MAAGDPTRRRVQVARGLMALGVVGAVVALVATVVGVRLLNRLDDVLGQSTEVTGEAVAALADSVGVAQDVVASLDEGLAATERTTRGLVDGFGDASAVLGSTAELTETRIADGLASVDEALPALIDVAAVIDTTLSALSAVPFGPDYDPDEPFDESLRDVRRQIAPLPGVLREQADLIRASQESLAAVSGDAGAIADELAELRRSIDGARTLLADFARTAERVDTLVRQGQQDLGADLTRAAVLLAVLGAVTAVGQVVPFGAGWLLRDPQRATRYLVAGARD